MDIAAIAAFVAAADERSFTAGGHKLGITASGVSKAITRLESELQLRLFNRSTRTISLTPDGTAFYSRCRQILLDLDDAKQSMLKSQVVPSGRLRVSVPVAFGRAHVIPAVAAFLNRYPQIQVDVNVTDRFVDMVEEGFDALVRIGELSDSRLIARPLMSTNFVVCGSPQYLSDHPRLRRPQDLDNHDCVKFVSPETHRIMDWRFVDAGKSCMIAPAGRLSVDNGEALIEAALCHTGLIYIQDYMVQHALSRKLLQVVLGDFTAPPRPIVVMYPQNRHLSGRVRVFVDFLVRQFGNAVRREAMKRTSDEAAR